MIRLSVPGTLEYRDVAMRVVTAASKLVRPEAEPTARGAEEFDAQVISAFGEAFNNIAIHAYGDSDPGPLEVEIEVLSDGLRIRILDHGKSFDPATVAEPELDDLPERGMGLFIIRSFMDDVRYAPGKPNVLEMVKHWCDNDAPEEVRLGPSPKRRPSGWRMTRPRADPVQDEHPERGPNRVLVGPPADPISIASDGPPLAAAPRGRYARHR